MISRIDRQKVPRTINEALQAVRGLGQAIDKDNSTLAEIGSQVLLDEVKSLLQRLEAEKDDLGE